MGKSKVCKGLCRVLKTSDMARLLRNSCRRNGSRQSVLRVKDGHGFWVDTCSTSYTLCIGAAGVARLV